MGHCQHPEMAFFKGLFGKQQPKEVARAPTADDTIRNMKSTQEMLKKKQSVLEAKISSEADNAKRLASLMKTNPRKKNEAMMHLKRKKMYETQFNQLDNQILNLDQTIFAMEKSMLNETIINSQKEANRVLKQQLATTGDATEVEDVLADLDENVDEVNQIGDVLAQDMSFGNDIDESELEEELMGMEDELNAEALSSFEDQLLGPDPTGGLDMPVIPSRQTDFVMPTVPSTVEEEDPFAGLEAEMAI